jgi:hypothetical protein
LGGVKLGNTMARKPVGADPFRVARSKYEAEEPFAVALVAAGLPFDWSAEPVDAVWLPESFFNPIFQAAASLQLPLLSRLDNLYEQYRFTSSEAGQIVQELEAVASSDLSPDLQRAARLAAAIAAQAASSDGTLELIIEGP